jgi:transcriptional regulator with XRE-family HTH domain
MAGVDSATANTARMTVAPNRLRELRELRGLTRTEVAFRLGVSEGAVVRWENQTMGIADRHKPKIARLLNTTVDELMAGWPEADD